MSAKIGKTSGVHRFNSKKNRMCAGQNRGGEVGECRRDSSRNAISRQNDGRARLVWKNGGGKEGGEIRIGSKGERSPSRNFQVGGVAKLEKVL